MSLDYVSNQEIIQAARRNLPQDVWDYLTGGAELFHEGNTDICQFTLHKG